MNKTFDKVFYVLSFFYIFYFYIFPLIIISYQYDNIDTLYDLLITKEKIFFAWKALFIFLLGFISYDVIKILYKKKVEIRKFTKSRKNIIVYICLVCYILFLFYNYFTTSIDNIYAVKKGLAEGSWFKYFLTLIGQSIKYAILFLLIKSNISKKIVILFLFITIFFSLHSGIGRFDLLLDIIIVFILIFNINAFKTSIIIFISLFLFLPLLFNLKSIIFMVATNTFTMQNILEVINKPFDYGLYINNFSHPLVSLIMSDRLIDKIGFRFFYDYLHDFLFYLKIIGFDVGGTLTYYNTENLLGKFESIVPPGYLAFGYIQLGMIGIFTSGFFYRLIGILGKKIYLIINYESEVIKFLIAFLFANSFYHGEIRIMILTLFLKFSVILIILKFFTKEYHVRYIRNK